MNQAMLEAVSKTPETQMNADNEAINADSLHEFFVYLRSSLK